jgi:hypothetical protein
MKTNWILILAAAIGIGSSDFSSAVEPASAEKGAIESIGVYFTTDVMSSATVETIPFFKACGYNTYQFWDMGWSIPPSKHERSYFAAAENVERMQREGFRVFVILTVNMHQCKEGEPEGYHDSIFDPGDRALMKERLEYLTATVRKLKAADGFTIFAGDPGGHPQATPAQFSAAVKEIIAMISRESPRAEIHVNPWSIASWDHFISPFLFEFWEKETRLSRDLVGQPELFGPGVQIEFPLHAYYRSLTIKCYADAGKPLELFPKAEDIAALKGRGVKRMWGWPYFLTDECDDGYRPGTAGLAQSEIRYIKQIIDTGRKLGLDGMIANVFQSNISSERLNLYAFARFCKDSRATPDLAIREFAGFCSEPETADDLAAVLKFIENNSTWQAGMQPERRLPNFDTGEMKSPQDALNALAKVVARKQSDLPMPRPTADYLLKLKERLEMLK